MLGLIRILSFFFVLAFSIYLFNHRQEPFKAQKTNLEPTIIVQPRTCPHCCREIFDENSAEQTD